MSSGRDLALGIDIGGTAIKAGAVTRQGEVLVRCETRTDGSGPAAVIEQVESIVAALCSDAGTTIGQIAGVGLGVPGIVEPETDRVRHCANLRGWTDVDIAAALRSRLGVRHVVVDNDANNAALAEALAQGDTPSSTIVMLTLGTGIGSGIVHGGRLWRGAHGGAGEIGHTIVAPGGRACGCGQFGCLETYASATSTALRVLERIQAGDASVLAERVRAGETIDSRGVAEAVVAGDALAMKIWQESCEYLAIAVVNIQHTIDPALTILGGGMSAAGDVLLRPVREAAAALYARRQTAPPVVMLARLGNDAGFMGAARNVFSRAGA